MHSFVGTKSHKWAANIGNLFGNAKCFRFLDKIGMTGEGLPVVADNDVWSVAGNDIGDVSANGVGDIAGNDTAVAYNGRGREIKICNGNARFSFIY